VALSSGAEVGQGNLSFALTMSRKPRASDGHSYSTSQAQRGVGHLFHDQGTSDTAGLGCLHRDVDTMTRGLFRFLAHQHQIVTFLAPKSPAGVARHSKSDRACGMIGKAHPGLIHRQIGMRRACGCQAVDVVFKQRMRHDRPLEPAAAQCAC